VNSSPSENVFSSAFSLSLLYNLPMVGNYSDPLPQRTEIAVMDRIVNEGGFDELRKRLVEALRRHVCVVDLG